MKGNYLKINRNTVLLILLLCTSLGSIAQQELMPEVPDDPQIFVDRVSMQRGASWSQRGSDLMTTQVNVDENGDNILGDAGNEPSIAVDPTNPDRIVIGWRQFDTVESNFRQAGYGYSEDGGQTFIFPGVLDPGLFRSDPVLDFDSEGNFFYNSLQGDFTCDVFRITDGGTEWSEPVPANGGDKQWMRIDRSGGEGDGNNYSYWNRSFTTCDNGDFTRSTDGALSFEDCEAVAESPRWGTLAVGPDGVLHIVGVAASTGEVKLISSSNAQEAGSDIVWDQVTTVDLEGFLNIAPPVNPQGLMGQAWVDVDQNTGDIYVLSSVTRTGGSSDPADVMFARSSDGGATFDPPVRINTDAGNAYQWFGTMSVAPNGRIDVVWLDTRDADNVIDSVLYYTFSEDRGTTWEPEQPLSPSFDPSIGYPQQNKMGDYFDMVSDNEAAHLAWTNTINGGQDVYYSRISPQILQAEDIVPGLSLLEIYPNPFSGRLNLDLNLKDQAEVTIKVFNLLGQEVATIVEGQLAGVQNLSWSAADQVSGLYLVEIVVNGSKEVRKVLLQ